MAGDAPTSPAIEFREGPAASPGPIPGIRWSDHSVELDLPGQGSIVVSGTGIIVLGPDEDSRQQVHAQLGTWARGQWLRANGLTAVNGTCIAREGRSIVFTGAPRIGCSLLALVLLERGWQLASDGIVAWGDDCVPLTFGGSITADRIVVPGIDPARVSTAISGRDRVHIQAPAVGTGTITGSVFLGRRLALTGPRVSRSDPSTANRESLNEHWAAACIPTLVPASRPTDTVLPQVPILSLVRPRSIDEAIVRSSAPPILAELIEPTLLELCS